MNLCPLSQITRGCSVDDGDDYLDIFYDAPETQSQCDFENSFRASEELSSDENNSSSDDRDIPDSNTIVTPSKVAQHNGIISGGNLKTPSEIDMSQFSPNTKKKLLKYRYASTLLTVIKVIGVYHTIMLYVCTASS